MKEFKLMVFGFALFYSVFALPTYASECNKVISTTTDLGDGMKMMQYADHSGFELTSGAARLTYNSQSKMMTMIDERGEETTVAFDNNLVSLDSVPLISQR